ncbi:hypothetical protein C2G38_2227712 [Gigaspora rosea]|uniref:Uncharacterized protein n=1 Tax=Gigaspora rosea TaxID=44941 RepID=A0A397TZX9_9GLOM|nr:hypothetical protein C2G38_2227712 [Gigaspora rosea]
MARHGYNAYYWLTQLQAAQQINVIKVQTYDFYQFPDPVIMSNYEEIMRKSSVPSKA